MTRSLIAMCVLAMLAVALVSQQPGAKEQAGPLAGGGYLLVSGWKVNAAGRQVAVDTFPMAAALAADGRRLFVLNGGYQPPSVSLIDTAAGKELSRTRVADGWLGLKLSPAGDRLWVGGGSKNAVFEFAVDGERLTPSRTLAIPPEPRAFIGDVALSPDGKVLYAASLYQDSLARISLETGQFIDRIPTAARPYRIVFHPDGKSLLVSSWGDNVIARHDLATGKIAGRVDVGPHPTDMLWDGSRRLFVTVSNTNYVAVLDSSLRMSEKINVAMTPRQPVGMTPGALALDGGRLYVVCSDANAVAVVDVSKKASSVAGFIPAGWYPTGVMALPGGRLAVLNGRGLRSFPNPGGPSPAGRPVPQSLGTNEVQYVGRIQKGTISLLDSFDGKTLAGFSKTVMANSPYRDTLLDDARAPKGNPVPGRPGGKSPIEHVVYIIKENRTYDQVFGALGKGNGDPSLVLFGENVTPNHHKLAREFVLLDNFYVSADVSADGHNWSMAAIAPDFTQKVWPNGYGKRGTHRYLHGQEQAALTPNGYLWTHALAAGLSMRNYGYLGVNKPGAPVDGPQLTDVLDPILKPLTDYNYRAYDLTYRDVDRARAFLADLARHERKGEWARFVLIRLGNNHTQGTTPGRPTPIAQVADNDAAFGMIVEGISKSRFWPRTAVFVLEDDAQNGPDHVDSHRSPAFVISPYVRRGSIDSTMYNTTSMLRTMELLLGLNPMTHFDAGARPMFACFTSRPDTRPYKAEPPRVSLDEVNPAKSATSARSLKLDFSEADLIDDDEMNDILWIAVRGTEPPAPVRSYFAR